MRRDRIAFAVAVWAAAACQGAAVERDGNAAAVQRRDEVVRRIDSLLEERWRAEGVEPAAEADDGEFLRRAYLDLTGVIPRTAEVREFLQDDRPEKRRLLVDALLASPRHATHMATTWRNRILPHDVDPARMREALGLQKWLRARFAKNLRYDNLVGGLLLATSEDQFGPALYFQANDLAPEKMAASVAELFLGVDLHCAQCHDHPFADWSQQDFWGMAAFFARVKAPSDRGMMRVSYRLVDADEGEVTFPDSDKVAPPKYPRGEQAPDEPWQTRRMQLVVWMTSRDNQFFSRAAVNWAWNHLFGQPLAASLSDVAKDQESHQWQELLDVLAEYFVESDFDLQELWRTLAQTRAYGLSSRHADVSRARPELFARMLAKPLTPEQLYDSFEVLAPVGPPADDGESQAASLDSFTEDPLRAEFVRRMRSPPGAATEYRAGALQALLLMNGDLTARLTDHRRSRLLGALEASFMADEDRIETLFLATLARRPDSDERAVVLQSLRDCKSPAERRRAFSDLLWALVNSTEFAFNH